MLSLAIAFAATICCSVGATWLVLRELRRRAILDQPNLRSSHVVPTPRGGGLAVVPVVLAAWAVIAVRGPVPPGLAVVLGAAALLALVSWIDDLRGLSAALRLLAHAAAVLAGLVAMAPDALVFGGLLPLPADRVLTGLLWIWFVNLFNFMDGIDGISGVELISIGGGVALVALLAGGPGGTALLAAALLGAAAGFLVWNWPPARVFLGDVGSVPLGYLCGWLLIHAAQAGLWWAAVILPLYYLSDSTITLLRRLARGERVWEAHRTHFYQAAVQRGLSHGQVTMRILVANLVLIGSAIASLDIGGWAVLPAIAAVAILIAALNRGR